MVVVESVFSHRRSVGLSKSDVTGVLHPGLDGATSLSDLHLATLTTQPESSAPGRPSRDGGSVSAEQAVCRLDIWHEGDRRRSLTGHRGYRRRVGGTSYSILAEPVSPRSRLGTIQLTVQNFPVTQGSSPEYQGSKNGLFAGRMVM